MKTKYPMGNRKFRRITDKPATEKLLHAIQAIVLAGTTILIVGGMFIGFIALLAQPFTK